MNCQPTHSLQSRAALLQPEMHMYDVKMDLHQYLTHRRRMRRGGQRRRYWSRSWMRPERWRQFGMYYQLYGKCVRKYILLNPASACWCPFYVRFVRYASGTRSDCLLHVRLLSVTHSELIGLLNWSRALHICYRYVPTVPCRVHVLPYIRFFLQDWPFCHRIFFLSVFIRFTFVGSIRSSLTAALFSVFMSSSDKKTPKFIYVFKSSILLL